MEGHPLLGEKLQSFFFAVRHLNWAVCNQILLHSSWQKRLQFSERWWRRESTPIKVQRCSGLVTGEAILCSWNHSWICLVVHLKASLQQIWEDYEGKHFAPLVITTPTCRLHTRAAEIVGWRDFWPSPNLILNQIRCRNEVKVWLISNDSLLFCWGVIFPTPGYASLCLGLEYKCFLNGSSAL